MRKIKCEGCGRRAPSFEVVDYGSMDTGYKQLCRRCFNMEAATAAGLDDFEHVDFEPVRLTDSGGKPHEFHFRTFMFETGVALDAFELREGNPAGYQFQVNAEPEEDQLALLGRLIEKLRRALAVQHIADGEHGLRITEPLVVRGLIDWDSEQGGSTPMLAIDGREISWDEFGRMISSFEGFQFKLEIRDKSEEI